MSQQTVTLQPLQRPRLYWTIVDTWTLFKRNAFQIANEPGQLAYSLVFQPLVLIILMNILFGKAIHIGASNYISFLLPAMLVGNSLMIATIAMISVTSDMTKGMMDRFRSLPMTKAAIFGGTVLSSALRCMLAVAVMLLVGGVLGFHPKAAIGAWAAALGLVLLVSYAFSWLFALLGLTSKSVESAQQLSGIVWPFFFVSGVFVPVSSMPGWLRGFATNQPITQAVDAVRSLLLGQPIGNHAWVTSMWCGGIVILVVPLVGWLFKRRFQ